MYPIEPLVASVHPFSVRSRSPRKNGSRNSRLYDLPARFSNANAGSGCEPSLLRGRQRKAIAFRVRITRLIFHARAPSNRAPVKSYSVSFSPLLDDAPNGSNCRCNVLSRELKERKRGRAFCAPEDDRKRTMRDVFHAHGYLIALPDRVQREKGGRCALYAAVDREKAPPFFFLLSLSLSAHYSPRAS